MDGMNGGGLCGPVGLILQAQDAGRHSVWGADRIRYNPIWLDLLWDIYVCTTCFNRTSTCAVTETYMLGASPVHAMDKLGGT